ncbi:hypothetical protein EJ08DRAFT_108695 [Tothia fuscella]|uniref:DUF7137 domain-containing protein n=1 Tax=Tothia fuscella TaxID=1048955 RepID=A0A9P4U191_9PEZI|nr:hypothetical protein EJ08DRAFT_108695 [Tothia fuscella]
MRSSQLLVAVASFSALSSAWPMFDFGGEKAVQATDGMLHKRQDGTTSASTDRTTSATSRATASPGATKTTGSTSASASASGTEEASSTITSGSSSGGDSGNSSLTTSYGNDVPAGAVVLKTPNPFSGSAFYKIGDYVTFGWNYTNLLATPTAINVVASCKKNQAIYTIAANQTFEESARVVWDTGKYQKTGVPQLLTEQYHLIIYDANSSIDSLEYGHLSGGVGTVFGMYTPQPYTPWAEYTCPSCSAAMSQMERQTLGFLLGMMTVTSLSFTWFGNLAGLF